MKLIETLKLAVATFKNNPPAPYVHKEETANELYDKVIRESRRRAETGCSTMLFHWDYVFTSNRKEWNRQHKVCLEVVHKLEKEGISAKCNSKFPEPYVAFDGQSDTPIGHHNIVIKW